MSGSSRNENQATGQKAFASPIACCCSPGLALRTQCRQALAEHNAALPEDRRMWFRIGVNLGDLPARLPSSILQRAIITGYERKPKTSLAPDAEHNVPCSSTYQSCRTIDLSGIMAQTPQAAGRCQRGATSMIPGAGHE